MANKVKKKKPMKQVTVKVDPSLNLEINQAIEEAEALGVFAFSSLSDFYRSAWTDYMKGLPLAPRDNGARTVKLNLFMTECQRNKWDQLPARKRSIVMERAARNYLKMRLNRRIDYARNKAAAQAEEY